jgi:hypothetical protein
VIHYHGTPITPKVALEAMAGEHFCVSFFRPDNLKTCLRIGQSLMLDNGAFSCKTLGVAFDRAGFYRWLDPILAHPHWGVVPDVIDGDVELQREMVKSWPYPKSLGIPVWHLGLSIDYLLELCDDWGRVCFGSAGQYWQVGSPIWAGRMDEAFNALHRTFGQRLPWVHGMRMLGQGGERWPLASADSTNVAVNHARKQECAKCFAKRIDAQNPPNHWEPKEIQQSIFSL